jgi:hypothetical protein
MFSNDLRLDLISIDIKMLWERKLSRKVPVLSTWSCPALARAISASGSPGGNQ